MKLVTALASLAAALVCACSTTGKFVWVDDYAARNATKGSAGYLIAPGDVLWVRVFNQDAVSARVKVRRDGDSVDRIRFTWERLAHGEGRSAAFRLQPGDVVVVE